MMSERALVDAIFKTALKGCEADVHARKNALWLAATTLLSDVLLQTDPFNRERLLHGLVAELRKNLVDLEQALSKERAKIASPDVTK
jgi:hypothetical protein